MPDEEAALAEALDTPEAPEGEAAPEGTPADSPAIDWETDDNPYKGRYGDLRSDYDRRNQKFSQYEQFVQNLSNPETQAEALKALGLEIEAEESDDDYADPDERWEQRFSQIESHLQQQAAEREAAEVEQLESQYRDQELGKIEKDAGKLSKQEKDAVADLADRLRDEDGVPDYEAAFKRFTEAAEAHHKRYVESKKSEVPGVGQAGTEKIDLTDDDTRVRALANIMEAGAQD